jgi:hypothetical protein
VDCNYTRTQLNCIELSLESGLNLGSMCRTRLRKEEKISVVLYNT